LVLAGHIGIKKNDAIEINTAVWSVFQVGS